MNVYGLELEVQVEAPASVVNVNALNLARMNVATCMGCSLHVHGPIVPDHHYLAGDEAGHAYGVLASTPVMDGTVERVLRSGMRGNGYVLGAVQCVGDGDATAAQEDRCRGNVEAVSKAVGLEKWVLVGWRAVRAWQVAVMGVGARRVTPEQMAGRVGVWPGVGFVVAVPDPMPANTRHVVATLRMYDTMDAPLDWLGAMCVECGGGARRYTRDGLGWCKAHWNGVRA